MRRIWLAVALISAACADEIPEDVSQQMEAARAANEAESDTAAALPDIEALLRTAPPGGHTEWIRDVRSGLDSVPAEAALDRGAALHSVQELYARRFDALRAFFGPVGAINAGPAVSDAVAQTSVHLHELMRQLASDDASAEAIELSVRAAQAALDSIASAARAAGVAPTAPRDGVPISD